MAKLKGLLARLAKAIVNLGNITTDKGVLSWDGEEDLKEGDAVFIEDAEGNRVAAADGEYMTEDGKTIVVVDGKVSEIRDPKAEVAPAEPEENAAVKAVQTDKGKLEWDNEDEDLKEGDAVYITDEEGNRNPAPDGDYTTEDGKVISVVDGKVTSITDPKAEVDEEGEAQKETEALRAENEALRSEIEELKAKVEEMTARTQDFEKVQQELAAIKKTPAGKPAHEEFANQGEKAPKTGSRGLDRIAELMDA